MNLEITEIKCEDEPGYILVRVNILGADHHVEFIRVEEDDLGCQQVWEPEDGENNNASRFDSIQEHHSGYYQTFKLPGQEGDWICIIFPFAN
jgi:hypothetical protein